MSLDEILTPAALDYRVLSGAAALGVGVIFLGLSLLARDRKLAPLGAERWGSTAPLMIGFARPFRLFAIGALGDLVQKTNHALEKAGRPDDGVGGVEYVAVSLFLGALVAAVSAIGVALRAEMSGFEPILLGFFILIAVIYMRHQRLETLGTERSRAINTSFPYFLDTMVLSLDAGANTPDAIDLYVTNSPGDPLTEELKLARDQTAGGMAFSEALVDLAERMGDKDLRTVVLNIRHSMEMGASLADTLRTQATDIRFFRTQNVERAIERMRVQIQFPLVLALMSAMIITVGPAIVTAARSGMF